MLSSGMITSSFFNFSWKLRFLYLSSDGHCARYFLTENIIVMKKGDFSFSNSTTTYISFFLFCFFQPITYVVNCLNNFYKIYISLLLKNLIHVCVADRLWEYVNRSQIHECRNWKRGRAVSFMGIFVSNFWYSALAVYISQIAEY